jgi:predicted DCC family thiol-disulfide oxidoreductase YuxK
VSRPLRYPLTVFYDASCPLCASEMHALRELDAAGRIDLVDCSAPGFSDEGLRADGITRASLMRRIHARDACGRWRVGIDAFEAVYRAAGLEAVAQMWASPRWRPLFERLYPWIARYRQPLSRLGMHRLVRRFIRSAANRQAAPGRAR